MNHLFWYDNGIRLEQGLSVPEPGNEMEADNRTEGAEATTLHPGFLHALHLGDAKTNTTTSFEPPGSSPPLNTQPLSRPSDTCSEESEYLPARRGVYAARGTIVHIRRASRKTTFVDIDLVARGSREAGADAAEVAVSREVSECCDSENSTPGNVDFLPLEQPDMGQGHEHGVSADGIKPDCSQDTASFRNSDSRQKRSGLSRLEQATLDQATPEPAIPERATSDCSNCSRLELMIPGSLLASLPQKLRIGSVVECQGESLENLSAAPAGTPQSGSSFRNTDDKSQVQKSTFTNNEDGGFLAEPLQNETEDKLENRRCEISTGEALREDEHVSEKYCSLQEAGFDRVPESRCEESSLVGEGGFDIDWMLRVSSLKVFDPRGSASGNEFLYKHLAAKSELPSICRGGRTVLAKPGVCKYWVNEGRCARGSDCPYEHPPHGEPLKKARAEYLAAKSSGDHALGNAGKAKRAQVFGDWVKETYGAGSAGLQVMDIAAGAHGELAFHLAVSHEQNLGRLGHNHGMRNRY